MALFDQWVLTIILFWPLLAAIIVLFIPQDQEDRIRRFSIWMSVVPLILSALVFVDYGVRFLEGAGGLQYELQVAWIPQLGASYHVGADGLSVPLIFLTALLTTLSLYYSARTIHHRVKEFFFLFLLLETGMFGVFMALDLVLFYVFWEVGLVPMFFLIGIWGHENREYAAIKFFLYTLVGSVAMLLAFLALYFAEAPTAGSVILAGILLKLGAYGFLRLLLGILPHAFAYWGWVIVGLGVISIVYACCWVWARPAWR